MTAASNRSCQRVLTYLRLFSPPSSPPLSLLLFILPLAALGREGTDIMGKGWDMNVSHLLSILALAGVFPALRSCFANLATWRKFSNMEVGERHSLQARLSLCVCPALKPLPFSECIFCVFVYLCVFAVRPALKPLLFSECICVYLLCVQPWNRFYFLSARVLPALPRSANLAACS